MLERQTQSQAVPVAVASYFFFINATMNHSQDVVYSISYTLLPLQR